MFGDTRHTNNVATISLLSCDVGHSASFRVVPSIGGQQIGAGNELYSPGIAGSAATVRCCITLCYRNLDPGSLPPLPPLPPLPHCPLCVVVHHG